MVGRDDELSRLTEAWRDVRAGRGRTVVIGGEPGVGKSRLLACFRATLEGQPHRWLALRCSPLRINTAFHPVAEMVRTSAGIRLTDEPEEQRRLIRAALPDGQAGAELPIAALLGLETEGLPGAREVPPRADGGAPLLARRAGHARPRWWWPARTCIGATPRRSS